MNDNYIPTTKEIIRYIEYTHQEYMEILHSKDKPKPKPKPKKLRLKKIKASIYAGINAPAHAGAFVKQEATDEGKFEVDFN